MSEFDFKYFGLGSFYCEYKDKKIDGSEWVSKRALYIFMYLLQERQRIVNIEELVDIFWPESELEDGKNNLYNTVYRLRVSLKKSGFPKDIVKSLNGAYTINNSYHIWTDWNHFEKNINALISGKNFSIQELESIFELYRGDFFNTLKYEGWTDITREKMREYYLLLIENITEQLYNEGNYRDAVSYLHKGMENDPYRENFYLLYIRTLMKLGRIAEAINSYKMCKKILKEELNVPPGQELENEFQRIKMNREISENIHENIDTNPIIEKGAMFCELEVFQKIYELELRQVKRINKEFVLLTIDFTGLNIDIDFDLLINKIARTLRKEDVISFYGEKVYIILKGMEVFNSVIIMQRLNKLCERLNLKKRPSLNIKEII